MSTAVWITRRGVNSGSSARFVSAVSSSTGTATSSSLAELSSDTPGKLPVCRPLQALQAAVDREDERLGERLGAPHPLDQPGAGEEIGHVVLAQVDEGEAEGERVAPAERPRDAAGFRQRDRADEGRGEVERGHRGPRVAAEG